MKLSVFVDLGERGVVCGHQAFLEILTYHQVLGHSAWASRPSLLLPSV